jgi:hypothetical protein
MMKTYRNMFRTPNTAGGKISTDFVIGQPETTLEQGLHPSADARNTSEHSTLSTPFAPPKARLDLGSNFFTRYSLHFH